MLLAQYGPPNPLWPETLWSIAVHSVLLCLGIGVVWGLLFPSRQPVRAGDFWAWGIGLLTMTGLSAWGLRVETARPFLAVYLAVAWCAGGVGLAMTYDRFRTGKLGRTTLSLFAVIGLGFVIMLLQPAVPQARDAARQAQCKSNLKAIGLAFHTYHDAHRQFPPPQRFPAGLNGPAATWRLALLPYLDHQFSPAFYNEALLWSHPANHAAAATRIPEYECPSRGDPTDRNGRRWTAFAMVTGAGTVGESARRSRSISECTDGLSTTILVVEACGRNIVWTEPRDIDPSRDPVGVNLPGATSNVSPGTMSSLHYSGPHVLLGDGSVRPLPPTTSPAVLRALMTANGREKTSLP